MYAGTARLALVVLVLTWAQSVLAAPISLSTISSDATPASVLDATLDFQIIGNTVNLTVSNDTTAPDAYAIDSIFFTVTADVDLGSIALISVGGNACPACAWSLSTGIAADGMGVFDVGLIGPAGNDPDQVTSGESVLFVLTANGAFDMSDFASELSSIPPGANPAFAVAKVVRGPGDDSAFGGTNVPEPGTGLLVLLGLSGLAAAGRRRQLCRVLPARVLD